jgi:hypothetical protein
VTEERTVVVEWGGDDDYQTEEGRGSSTTGRQRRRRQDGYERQRSKLAARQRHAEAGARRTQGSLVSQVPSIDARV